MKKFIILLAIITLAFSLTDSTKVDTTVKKKIYKVNTQQKLKKNLFKIDTLLKFIDKQEKLKKK